MLGESLRVPFRADDWIGTILVGSTLTLLVGLVVTGWAVVLLVSPPVGGLVVPLVALPSLVLRGYLVSVVRSGLGGDRTVDSFVAWGRLARDGTRSAFISAMYLLPAALLAGLALGGGVATAVDPDGFDGAVQALAAVVILFAGFGALLYGLVYLYVRPAARAVFASTGSVRAALGVRRVLGVSASGEYITGWLIGMGVLVVGPILLVPLLLVSLAFGVISPGVAFVGVLSTILLGIGTVFVCRVAAAYATGRGSAVGVIDLYPTARIQTADGSVTVQPTEPHDDRSTVEPPVAVQTGRTVDMDTKAAVSASSSADHTEAEASDDGKPDDLPEEPDRDGPPEEANRDEPPEAANRDEPPEEIDEGLSELPVQPHTNADSADEKLADAEDLTEAEDSEEPAADEADEAEKHDDEPTADEFIWGPDDVE